MNMIPEILTSLALCVSTFAIMGTSVLGHGGTLTKAWAGIWDTATTRRRIAAAVIIVVMVLLAVTLDIVHRRGIL